MKHSLLVLRHRSRGRSSTLLAGALWMSALLALSLGLRVHAVPYASGLTNNAGTISFRLNESADNVKVVSNGGATTNDLQALAAGWHTFALSITGDFQVMVSKASPAGYATPVAPNRASILQISTDTNLLRFNQPRGLVVNTDPASPHFGRVYISNSMATNTPGFPRNVGDGIYVLNSDLTDALGQGDTALNAGLDFSASATASPYRLTIGTDNNLYITDWSDTNGSLYVTDPHVGPGSGQNVLGGLVGGPFPVTTDRIHGSIAAAVVLGSLTTADLTAYVVDEDLQDDRTTSTANQRESLWRHDIGGSLPGPFVMPTRVALHPSSGLRGFGNQTMDMTRGTNGYFYISNYRSVGNEGNFWVLDGAGTLLWNSLTETRALLGNPSATDLLKATGGSAVSPLGDFAAVINIETNGIFVLPLLNGLPDLTNRLALNGFNTTTGQGRDITFDAAGNLYAVSSGAGMLRVFSPGGTTTAITGSDGSFNLTRPPGVSVLAEDPVATEDGSDTARFRLMRNGGTNDALTVLYTLTGTASNGVDYLTNTFSAIIPAGEYGVEVTVTGLEDTEPEFTESVILTLLGAASYDLRPPVFAQVDIIDNESDVISVRPGRTNTYEGTPTVPLTFTVERRGDTNIDLFIQINTSAGVAIAGVDYADIQQIYLPAGVVTINVALAPLDDVNYEGDESVVVRVVPGSDPYVPGASDRLTGVLRDNEYPPAAVLFSDNFDANSSSSWQLRFGANNGIDDYTATFAYDYGAAGIPLAPHTTNGTTLGLYLQVNKLQATAGGSAGVNLYPLFENFTGNYALRCDMYLSFGTASSTEHALAGLNHSSERTNRVTQSADPNSSTSGGDGLFVAIESDGSANREWGAYTFPTPTSLPSLITNRSAAAMASVFPAPPFGGAGSPGNNATSTNKTWVDLELSQLNNVITLKANGVVVYSFRNPSPFQSGAVMLGMNDQFDSVGAAQNFVIFDNLQVVRIDFTLGPIVVTGNQVQIDFTSTFGANPSEFTLQTASSVIGPWTDDPSAALTATANGFRAVTTRSGEVQFYRLRR